MANPRAASGAGRAGSSTAVVQARNTPPRSTACWTSRVSAGRGGARPGSASREEIMGQRSSQLGLFLPVEKNNASISFPVQAGRGRAVGSKPAVAFRNYPNIHNRR